MGCIDAFGSDRAEGAVAAGARARNRARLFRADRSARRIRPGEHEDARGAQWRRLASQRREALDHERRARGRRRSSGPSTDDGPAAFLVEKGTPGFAGARPFATSCRCAHRTRRSSRSTTCGSRVRTGCPAADGLKAALRCLDQARFGIAWGALGAARACLAAALDTRASASCSAGRSRTHSSIQIRLAEAARALTAGQLLALRLGQLKDAGQATTGQVSLAKWSNVRAALDIARDCRDMLGAAGITLDHCADSPHAESRERDHLRRHGDDSPARRWSRADGGERF